MKNFAHFVESKDDLVLEPLPYKRTDLAPVMSKETIDYHYGTLAAGYVTRFNKGERDPKFNEAGAYLHNMFFPQLRAPQENNNPYGASVNFINKYFKSFDNFKEEIKKAAMKIQGSGWVYLDQYGKIQTITNHEIRDDILLIIDWWEHAWALDYQADKAKYLENIWKIINWTIINDRINLEEYEEE